MKHTYLLRIFSCMCLLFSLNALAQNTTVSVKGTVKSAESKEGLPGVNIALRGATTGTTTDANGNYSLTAARNGTLVFSSIGFEPLEISVRDRSIIDVQLTPDVKALGEVVVVGYTTQSKAKTTAATSKLNPEELKNTTNANPIQAIQGKIAGVSLPISSGQPGAGATNIIIRGGTKLNVYGSGLGNGGGSAVGSADNSNPLVVVDGVFRSMDDINIVFDNMV